MLKKLSLISIFLILILVCSSCTWDYDDIIYVDEDDTEEIIEYKEATCTEQGYKKYTKNGMTYKESYPALGHNYEETVVDDKYKVYTCTRCANTYQIEINHVHEFEEPDNYIIIQKCKNCNYQGRLEPDNSFLEKFKYFYTSEYDTEYATLVADIEKLIEEAKDTSSKDLSALCDKVIDKVDDLDEFYEEILPCYYYAEVKYYTCDDETYEDNYDKMLELINDIQNKYYNLEYQIFNSKLKELYFEGEDLEEVEAELKKYADDSIANLNTEISQLGDQAYYDDLDDETKFQQDIETLIEKRNELAKLYGYDSFYDYSYAEEYKRKYSSNEVQTYREFVLNRITSLYNKINNKLARASQKAYDEFNEYYYDQAWDNKNIILTVSNYFKTMKSTKYDLDMYETVNNAIKIGAIFIGEDSGIEGAYTNCSGFDQNICYFADTEYYSAALTFVHEFGHFMIPEEYLYTIDFDLAETHSQSNEAMYVRYLINNNILSYPEYFELIFVSCNLETIITTCMLDELEEALYKNYSSLSSKFEDGISYKEYDSLISAIEKKYNYNDGLSNWDYYFCTSSCYEISYGISLVPCLGLLATSKTDYNQAKETYIKVLRYYKLEDYQDTDSYAEILNKAGYYSPFDEKLYDLLDSTYGKSSK